MGNDNPPTSVELISSHPRRAVYPAYKPSGIEWLGDVPGHWEICRVKHIAHFNTGWTPPTSQDENYLGDNPWATIADLGPRFLSDTKGRISDEAVASSRMRISPKGSLLFSFKLSIGQVSIADRDMYTNEAIATFSPDNGSDVSYLYWAAPLFIPMNAEENIYGAKLLGRETIRNAAIVIPPLPEQQAIAAFLDRETARIDALIEKKRRQIELLKEKRSALITHAVTKGLNPDAPMKDSGIEWLGEVPEHWLVGNIRRFAWMKTGHTPSRTNVEYWKDCTTPWFTLADVWQLRDGRRKYLGETKEKISTLGLANSAAELLPAGTVIFSRTASIGFSGIMPLPMATSQDFWNWICGPSLLPDYLLCLFRSMRQEFEALLMGSTHKTIYQPIAAGITLCVPPVDEQKNIVTHVENETRRIDSLVTKIGESIDKAAEFRTALISAAVTGKIDVRGEV